MYMQISSNQFPCACKYHPDYWFVHVNAVHVLRFKDPPTLCKCCLYQVFSNLPLSITCFVHVNLVFLLTSLRYSLKTNISESDRFHSG